MKDLMYKSVVLASAFLAPVSNLFADLDMATAFFLPIRSKVTANDTIQEFPDLSFVRGRIEKELFELLIKRTVREIKIKEESVWRAQFYPFGAVLLSYSYLSVLPQWNRWGDLNKLAALGTTSVVVGAILRGIESYVIHPIEVTELNQLNEQIDKLTELMHICASVEAQPLSSIVHQEKYQHDLAEVYALCTAQADRSILDVQLENGQNIKDHIRALAFFSTQYVVPQAHEDSE